MTAPDVPQDRPYQCREFGANIVAVDRGAGVLQRPRDHRQVRERHQRDRSLELGQQRVSAAGAAPGFARQLREHRLDCGGRSHRMPTTSLCAPWTTRGRGRPDRPCRSGSGRRRAPWVSGSGRFATAARRPAPISRDLRRSQPGERDQPGRAARRSAGEPEADRSTAAHPVRKGPERVRVPGRSARWHGRYWSPRPPPAQLPLDPAFTPTRPSSILGPATPRRHPQLARLAEATGSLWWAPGCVVRSGLMASAILKGQQPKVCPLVRAASAHCGEERPVVQAATDDRHRVVEPADKHARVNVLDWTGKGRPEGSSAAARGDRHARADRHRRARPAGGAKP